MRSIIITDAHGCKAQLEALLNKIGLKDGDNLIGFSDINDKGPDSAGCIKYVRQLAEKYSVTLIHGNHEAKLFRFWNRYQKDPEAARKMKKSDELEATCLKLSKEDFEFLRTAQIWAPVPGMEAIVVHAGIQPAVKKLPKPALSAHTKDDLDKLSHFWFCRHVDVDNGRFVRLGAERAENPYWAEVYDGRFGLVFAGHQPFMKDAPQIYPHAVCLDLGCCLGGKLCAAVVEDGKVRYEMVDGFPYAKAFEVYPQKADA